MHVHLRYTCAREGDFGDHEYLPLILQFFVKWRTLRTINLPDTRFLDRKQKNQKIAMNYGNAHKLGCFGKFMSTPREIFKTPRFLPISVVHQDFCPIVNQ